MVMPNFILFACYNSDLAITANRKNTNRHIVLLGWSLGDEINEVAVLDIEREKWLPRIELQGAQNCIL
jgi:nuclear pore complex protein Nup214